MAVSIIMSSGIKTPVFLFSLQFRAYSHPHLMDAGSTAITAVFQARKERRVHSKKDKK